VPAVPSKQDQSEANAQTADHPSVRVVGVLALATAIAPIATDMYLPGLPRVAADFHVSTSSIQLTLTALLLGLAVGQLVIGPLSDGIGRRTPLLVGSAVCIVASALCAVAPTVPLLIAGRFVQGFSGAAGAVLGRAVIADRTRGAATARYFSLMMVITGLAPIIAPVIGALLPDPIGWRGILWVIAGLTGVMFIGLASSVPESLPLELRHSGGLRSFGVKARGVLGNRRFACYTVTFAFAFMTMFGWISASPFVLQDMLGLSTGGFALAFAANAVALLSGNAINVRVVPRYGQRRLIRIGTASLLPMSVLMGINSALGTWLWPTLILAFLTLASMGFILGNCASLAINEVRHAAGTGSAVLGAAQFGLGAVVAPIVGVAGSYSSAPLVISMIATSTIAVVAFGLAERAR
jgi:DHA1 family bicyclomycin/chloramphenicol resistance-like MFS transporter